MSDTPNIYASIIPACIHIHFSVRPFIHLSTYLPTLPAYPSVRPSVHPSMHPSRYVSIYSSICHNLPIYACLFILWTYRTYPICPRIILIRLSTQIPPSIHPSFTYQSIYLIWTPRLSIQICRVSSINWSSWERRNESQLTLWSIPITLLTAIPAIPPSGRPPIIHSSHCVNTGVMKLSRWNIRCFGDWWIVKTPWGFMQQTSFSNGLLWVAAMQSGPTPYFVKPESGYTSKYICMHNQQSSGSSAHRLLCGQVHRSVS